MGGVQDIVVLTRTIAQVLSDAVHARGAVLALVVDAVVDVLLAAVALEACSRAGAPVPTDQVGARAPVEAGPGLAVVHVLTTSRTGPPAQTRTCEATRGVQARACNDGSMTFLTNTVHTSIQ